MVSLLWILQRRTEMRSALDYSSKHRNLRFLWVIIFQGSVANLLGIYWREDQAIMYKCTLEALLEHSPSCMSFHNYFIISPRLSQDLKHRSFFQVSLTPKQSMSRASAHAEDEERVAVSWDHCQTRNWYYCYFIDCFLVICCTANASKAARIWANFVGWSQQWREGSYVADCTRKGCKQKYNLIHAVYVSPL